MTEALDLMPDTVVSRHGNVLAERVVDEMLILDLATDRCTRLNRTGSMLWEVLEAPTALHSLGERLEREFALEPAVARADAESFVRDLSSRGLVSVQPG